MTKRNCFINLSIILFLANVAFAGESTYNPNPSPRRYLFCTLSEPESRTVYYSSIFLTNEKNIYPIQDAFLHFVAQKHSYKIKAGVDEYHMPVRCEGTQNSQQASVTKQADIENNQSNAYKVIETKWTFGSQKPVEETSSSSSPASASSPANGPATQDDKLDSFTMATLQQDPRGMRLSPLDRQFVLSEAPKAKSFCAKDPDLSSKYDCTCFVTTLFSYRIAHATSPIQTTNFPPLASVLKNEDFKLTSCEK